MRALARSHVRGDAHAQTCFARTHVCGCFARTRTCVARMPMPYTQRAATSCVTTGTIVSAVSAAPRPTARRRASAAPPVRRMALSAGQEGGRVSSRTKLLRWPGRRGGRSGCCVLRR
eukprot:18407-Chlamydomonas_euryale.AAC.2